MLYTDLSFVTFYSKYYETSLGMLGENVYESFDYETNYFYLDFVIPPFYWLVVTEMSTTPKTTTRKAQKHLYQMKTNL